MACGGWGAVLPPRCCPWEPVWDQLAQLLPPPAWGRQHPPPRSTACPTLACAALLPSPGGWRRPSPLLARAPSQAPCWHCGVCSPLGSYAASALGHLLWKSRERVRSRGRGGWSWSVSGARVAACPVPPAFWVDSPSGLQGPRVRPPALTLRGDGRAVWWVRLARPANFLLCSLSLSPPVCLHRLSAGRGEDAWASFPRLVSTVGPGCARCPECPGRVHAVSLGRAVTSVLPCPPHLPHRAVEVNCGGAVSRECLAARSALTALSGSLPLSAAAAEAG